MKLRRRILQLHIRLDEGGEQRVRGGVGDLMPLVLPRHLQGFDYGRECSDGPGLILALGLETVNEDGAAPVRLARNARPRHRLGARQPIGLVSVADPVGRRGAIVVELDAIAQMDGFHLACGRRQAIGIDGLDVGAVAGAPNSLAAPAHGDADFPACRPGVAELTKATVEGHFALGIEQEARILRRQAPFGLDLAASRQPLFGRDAESPVVGLRHEAQAGSDEHVDDALHRRRGGRIVMLEVARAGQRLLAGWTDLTVGRKQGRAEGKHFL